jgi:enterochelin esterase-like enzyme
MLMRLAIMCLVLGITADLHGQNDKDSEKEIRSAYDAYNAAVRRRDVDGAMKLVTSDYTEHLTDGVVLDYAGSAESLKQTLSGAKTIGDVPTPTILDNLVAQKKIPPTILVLVNAGSQRIRDLSCSQNFAHFLVKELLPEVRRRYRVTADPKHVVVGGSSLGGLASACAGLMHPQTFGNILSLSGAYWYIPGWEKMDGSLYLRDSGWVMRQYLQGPKLPLRFYIDVGRYEEKQLSTNRNFRDILKLKGYPVTYSEFDGGHDYLCWRGSVADGLIALFGPGR